MPCCTSESPTRDHQVACACSLRLLKTADRKYCPVNVQLRWDALTHDKALKSMSDRRHVSFSSLVASLESGKLSVQKACQEIEACLLTNRYDHTLLSISAASHAMAVYARHGSMYKDDKCHAGTIIVASSSNASHTFLSIFLDTMAQLGLIRPHRYTLSCHTPSHHTACILANRQHLCKWLHHLHLAGHSLQSCCCSSLYCSPVHSLRESAVTTARAQCMHACMHACIRRDSAAMRICKSGIMEM